MMVMLMKDAESISRLEGNGKKKKKKGKKGEEKKIWNEKRVRSFFRCFDLKDVKEKRLADEFLMISKKLTTLTTRPTMMKTERKSGSSFGVSEKRKRGR